MFPGPPAALRVFPGPASNRDYAGCQFALYGPPAGRKPVGMCNPSRNNAYRAKIQGPIAISSPVSWVQIQKEDISDLKHEKQFLSKNIWMSIWLNSRERKEITGVNMIDL
jgi:hypothetical protein